MQTTHHITSSVNKLMHLHISNLTQTFWVQVKYVLVPNAPQNWTIFKSL